MQGSPASALKQHIVDQMEGAKKERKAENEIERLLKKRTLVLGEVDSSDEESSASTALAEGWEVWEPWDKTWRAYLAEKAAEAQHKDKMETKEDKTDKMNKSAQLSEDLGDFKPAKLKRLKVFESPAASPTQNSEPTPASEK